MTVTSEPATGTLDRDPRAAVAGAVPDSTAARALHAVHYAILAPSLHNSQPWLFQWRLDPLLIEIAADTRRQAPVLDPRCRQLVISCGAALKNLTVGLRAAGLS